MDQNPALANALAASPAMPTPSSPASVAPPSSPAPSPSLASPLSPDAQSRPARQPWVRYLEGLRGLACLIVTIYHVWGNTLEGVTLRGWQATARDWIGVGLLGRFPVDIFIVLSGYLLMRPAVRAGNGKLPEGIFSYIRRRALRILPPYYAALVIIVLIILATPALKLAVTDEWSNAIPAFGNHALLAHFLLIHNLSHNWASKIDVPMWTVATEWQIYFLFPILLLPIWRRLGSTVTICTALMLGLGGFLLTHTGNSAAPWFLALFAMGMVAAAREMPGRSLRYDRRAFGWMTLGLMLLNVALLCAIQLGYFRHFGPDDMESWYPYYWFTDITAGCATAVFLVYASAANRTGGSWIISALSSRWLVGLGIISYSLYLIHDPLLTLQTLVLAHFLVNPFQQFGILCVVGIPLIIFVTYGFHIVFERPFMGGKRIHGAAKALRPAAPVVAVAPIDPRKPLAQPVTTHILVLADLHIPLGMKQKRMLLKDSEFLQQQDWAILLGDVVAHSGSSEEYRQADRFVQAINLPYSVVSGNHEICVDPYPTGDDDGDALASPQMQLEQARRFNRFWKIDSCFQAIDDPRAKLLLLGLDKMDSDGCTTLSPEHEAWLIDQLSTSVDKPLIVFSHMPIYNARLDQIRYYRAGTRPYYAPSERVEQLLTARKRLTFWISGHLHLAPSNPLFEPYQAYRGLWQVHCPDTWGYGRPNNRDWRPSNYRGLFLRSLVLKSDRLSILTTDMAARKTIDLVQFDLLPKE